MGNIKTGGQWNDEEKQAHINEKELLAVLFSLKSLCKECTYTTIKVMSDNSTTVHYINNMGGRKTRCNQIARCIWEWAIQRDIWLIATFIPGKLNTQADKESRTLHSNTEWHLDPALFKIIETKLGPIDFDIFASRLTCQVPRYASWKPDPGAEICDGMSFDWRTINGYAFPPFSLIGQVLQKIEHDACTVVIVVPEFRSQPWFPKLLHMLIDFPLFISRTSKVLSNPVNQHETPIRANLIICKVSGLKHCIQEFQAKLQKSSLQVGDPEPRDNIPVTSNNLKNFVLRDKLIQCQRL